jgi:hypothetical protein
MDNNNIKNKNNNNNNLNLLIQITAQDYNSQNYLKLFSSALKFIPKIPNY